VPTRRERRIARKRRRNLVIALLGLAVSLAVVAVVLSLTNDGEAPEASRRNEAALLLAALNRAEPLTVGFSATYTLTVEGESTTTSITGSGRFVGADDADLTVMVEPEAGTPIDVVLVRTDGKRVLSVDGGEFRGGAGSVLPGVTGSLLDGLRTIIELDTLASELVLRGGGADQLLEVEVTDSNAGLDDAPILTTTFVVELDANDQPVAAEVAAVGGDPDDIQIMIALNMVFGPSSDDGEITLPATAVDGPGSALRYPVIAEALRVPYGYPPPVEVEPPASTSVTTALAGAFPTAPVPSTLPDATLPPATPTTEG
jgi:hypothetical protein